MQDSTISSPSKRFFDVVPSIVAKMAEEIGGGGVPGGSSAGRPAALVQAIEGVVPVLPPCGNTGVTRTDQIRVAHHWMEFTVHEGAAQAKKLIEEWLRPLLGEVAWEHRNTGKCGYTVVETGPHGMEVLSHPDRPEAHVIFTGRCCELCYENLHNLLHWYSEDVKFTRLDLAFDGWTDDDGKPISPARVFLDLRKDFSGIRTWAKRSTIRGNLGIEDGEDTLYVGSRCSERFVRMYDCRGYTRVELVLKGKRAELFRETWRETLGTPGMTWFKLCAGVLRDFLDFVVPSARPRRAPLAAWWQRGLESVDKLRQVVQRVTQPLEARLLWLQRQVAKTLALLVQAGGGSMDFFADLVADGQAKIRRCDEVLLQTLSPGWVPRLCGTDSGRPFMPSPDDEIPI